MRLSFQWVCVSMMDLLQENYINDHNHLGILLKKIMIINGDSRVCGIIPSKIQNQ